MLKQREMPRFRMQGDVATARVEGEIDHHSAAKVRMELDECIRRAHPKLLRLDLSGVTFMDSSGLGLIMGRYALMQQLGGNLTIYRPTGAVLRMVHLSGLERMVKIENETKEK